MKIEELEVLFTDLREEGSEEGPELSRETINQGLLQAVKNNFSLHTVKGEMEFIHESRLFESAEDKQRLAFYANRNKSLDQWADNPETVDDRKVWPEALGLAQRAGPTALFRGLRSVLESDYVIPKGGRKHKSPQSSAPL